VLLKIKISIILFKNYRVVENTTPKILYGGMKMIQSLLKESKVDKVLIATVAGTADTLNSDILDLQNCDSVMGIAILGDVTNTAVVTLKAYTGDNSALSDGAYETVTATVTADATSADNKLLILDIVKPGKRYCRFDLVRATANAVVDGIVAVRYNYRAIPTTQPSDVVNSNISVN
jgi:hypothetical protein